MSVPALASFEYLERLPGTTFRRLYQQPSTALAIFRRMLPHLAKCFVMALLYMPAPLTLSSLDLWVRPTSQNAKSQALSLLSRLHIVHAATKKPGEPAALALTDNFRTSLRLALAGGDSKQSYGVPASTEAEAKDEHVDVSFLDEYARVQWEGILHYVVHSVEDDSGDLGAEVAEDVKYLLKIGQLVDRQYRGGVGITQAGFTFLLQEVNAQVWTLLLLWIEKVEELERESLNVDPVDLLSFLFTLGSLELGLAYDTTTLTLEQRTMLPTLRAFGLVYMPSDFNRSSFYPTRLATTLTSDASALRSISSTSDGSTSASKGFIVIETNYRLYAYTSSPLQVAVLALFTKLSTRYPNMVSGRITRESIRRAIDHGITSDQIISYLSTHAHPQLRLRNPVLPPTVVDQIRLWQIENERMQATPGFLFKDFSNQVEFEECVRYADEVGVLVWRNDRLRCFFVTRHEQLKDFLRSRKARDV